MHSGKSDAISIVYVQTILPETRELISEIRNLRLYGSPRPASRSVQREHVTNAGHVKQRQDNEPCFHHLLPTLGIHYGLRKSIENCRIISREPAGDVCLWHLRCMLSPNKNKTWLNTSSHQSGFDDEKKIKKRNRPQNLCNVDLRVYFSVI